MALSLKPSDAQAGGFIDDVDVILKEVRFVMWDYMGQGPPTVALHVYMQDEQGQDHHQYYSAGDPSKMIPSSDGKTLNPAGAATGLNQNTNALAFISSLVTSGFPEDRIGEDVSIFDGLVCHINQVAQPKRSGLKDQKEGKTYALVTKILRLPWDEGPALKAPAKGAPKPAGKVTQFTPPAPAPPPVAAQPPAASASPAPTTAPDGALQEKARALVLAILAEKGGTLPKQKLPTEAFRALSNDSDRNAVVSLVFSEEFLQKGMADGTFSYDGTTISLGG
jgi:hypothetical protein